LENGKEELIYNYYTPYFEEFTVYPVSQVLLSLMPDRITLGGFFDE
jgi:hypothetical protein